MKKSIVIDKYQINFTCQYGYYPNSISIENGCRISYFNVVKIDEYKKAKNYYTYPIVKNYSIEYVDGYLRPPKYIAKKAIAGYLARYKKAINE